MHVWYTDIAIRRDQIKNNCVIIMKVNSQNKQLDCSIENQIGTGLESLSINTDTDLEIMFNVNFLIEIIKGITSEQIPLNARIIR